MWRRSRPPRKSSAWTSPLKLAEYLASGSPVVATRIPALLDWITDTEVELVDLPGHYGLNLERPESRLCRSYLRGEVEGRAAPDAVVVVADSTNLARNLVFVAQALQQGVPAVVTAQVPSPPALSR